MLKDTYLWGTRAKISEYRLLQTWTDKILPAAESGDMEKAGAAITKAHGSLGEAADAIALELCRSVSDMVGQYEPLDHSSETVRLRQAGEVVLRVLEDGNGHRKKDTVQNYQDLKSAMSQAENTMAVCNRLLRTAEKSLSLQSKIEKRQTESDC